MKKLFALALAAAMTMSIASCSVSNNNGGSSSGSASGSTSSAGSTSATESGYVYDESNPYPCIPYYREGDPKGDLHTEVTSTDDITWTIAVCLTESNPQSQAIKHMGEELEELTHGHFKWDIFYNSTLGSESEAVELVRNNTAQFVTSNVTTMASYVDTFGVFALPYLFHSEEDELTYLTTSPKAFELYKQLEEQSGLVSLGFNCTGSRCLSTKGVAQIKSPADLKGVKVRSMEAQVWQDVITSLGATPVPVAYTELYTALQTGVVQGQDNPVANTVDGKFYEVLDTLYKNDHCYLVSAYYANPTAWDQLPDDYKAVLLGLLQKYQGNYYHDEILKFREECEKTVADAGVKIVEQSDLDMDAFYKSAEDMINSKYMTGSYADYVNDVKATFNY